jgi:hypothetical protein
LRVNACMRVALIALRLLLVPTAVDAEPCPPTTTVTNSKYVATNGSTVVAPTFIQTLGASALKEYARMDAQVRQSESEVQSLRTEIDSLTTKGSQYQMEVAAMRLQLSERERERDAHVEEIMQFEGRIMQADAQIELLTDTLAKERAREALGRLDFKDVERLITNGFLELLQFRIGTGGVAGARPTSVTSDVALGFRLVNGQIGGFDTQAVSLDVIQRYGGGTTALQTQLLSGLILPACVADNDLSDCDEWAWGYAMTLGDFGLVTDGRRLLRLAELLPVVSVFSPKHWLTHRLVLFGGAAVDYVWNATTEPDQWVVRPAVGIQILERIGPVQIAANIKAVTALRAPVDNYGQEVYLSVLRQLSWRPGRRDQHMEASLQLGAAYWANPHLAHGVDWLSTSQVTVFARVVLAPSLLSAIYGTHEFDEDPVF